MKNCIYLGKTTIFKQYIIKLVILDLGDCPLSWNKLWPGNGHILHDNQPGNFHFAITDIGKPLPEMFGKVDIHELKKKLYGSMGVKTWYASLQNPPNKPTNLHINGGKDIVYFYLTAQNLNTFYYIFSNINWNGLSNIKYQVIMNY